MCNGVTVELPRADQVSICCTLETEVFRLASLTQSESENDRAIVFSRVVCVFMIPR